MQPLAPASLWRRAAARPAILLFVAVGAGFVLARAFPDVEARAWLLAALPCAALAPLRRLPRTARLASLLLAACLLSGAHFHFRVLEGPSGRLALSAHEVAPLAVEGVLLDDPAIEAMSRGRLAPFLFRPRVARTRLDVRRVLDPNTLEPVRATDGVLYVTMSDTDVAWRAGDRVRIVGLARGFAPPLNPGEPDRRLWANQMGVAGQMDVDAPEAITRAEGREGLFEGLERKFIAWRSQLRVRAGIVDASEDRSAGADLLAALVLGARDPATRDVRDDFTRVGLAHVLSISGLHLAALAFAALLALRLTGDHAWREPLLVGALILLYLLIVPARAPVLRAAAMTLALLAARGAGRRHDRLSLLAIVAIGVLLWRPLELFSAGFQLSFGVVAGFLVFSRRVEERLVGARMDPDHEPPSKRLARWLASGVGAAVIAQVISVPVVAFHFGVVSPYAWIATLLLAPLILPLLCAAYAVMLIGLVSPEIAQLLMPPLEALGGLLAWAGDRLEALPGSYVRVPPVGLVWTGCALAVGCWWLWSGSLRKAAATLALAGVVAWVALLARTDRLPHSVAARLDTFAVGDGTCHLLRSEGEAMLWDCGSLDLDIGERTLPSALRALGVHRVGTLVISHPNIDHYSAAIDVAEAVGVGRALVGEAVLEAAEADPVGAVAHTLDELRRLGVAIESLKAGDSWRVGAVEMEVLWPPVGLAMRRANDRSLVARATVATTAGARTILFSGDIEQEAMARLLASDTNVRTDVVEAPHHGSARPLAFAFVEETGAKIVVQSTGEGRVGDERWDEVKQSRRWWTTAADGAIHIEILKDGAIRDSSLQTRNIERET